MTAIAERDVKKVVAVLVLLLAVSACGDEGILSGLGDRGHEYVQGSTTTTIPGESVDETVGPTTVPVEGVKWFNEDIQGEADISDATYVISAVWSRRTDNDRFIQASPGEISTALAGIGFPSLLPETSKWVTSQLVYDVASATLDANTAAAFGVWSRRPYTDRGGQLAVLRTGRNLSAAAAPNDIRSVGADDGVSLIWTDGFYDYELFCVTEVTEAVCFDMAESFGPLEDLAPGIVPEVQAGG